MDVKSAFLNGYIDEEIYVEQPQGFIAKGSEEKVLRLKKALYGLKQAPRAWYSRIDKYFIDRGFRRSLSEPTLYIKSQGNDTLIISLYVDDLIYTGNNEKMIQDFKENMMKTFEMRDLGIMHFFLGIEINQEKEEIFICQRKYTETLLKKFKMESCKTVTTPLVTGEKYQKEDGSQKVDGSMYRSLIGSLLYLTATDQILCSPQVCYQDSDWAGSVDDMKSTSGYTFSLGSGIFSWASKKQATVAQSSASWFHRCQTYAQPNSTGQSFDLWAFHCDIEIPLNISALPADGCYLRIFADLVMRSRAYKALALALLFASKATTGSAVLGTKSIQWMLFFDPNHFS
ncbi:Retrovirus-related Pol polyprotein from transposon RE2 [Sesamum angolense]|uniref:Retrovirus-related Pol polyprotein from transposon RE2 n=1 Tax=Sesamum angolense TaxID=2727404 RepID=A0AAE2BHJ9_9LAMI|nr:Retrovirus-related Pol polyprotein from transposon RE2 [Sesamum angolense]